MCDRLIKAITNYDILIHESTYDDQYANTAYNRKHSTQSQAVSSGLQANVKYLILTHFS